MSNENTEKVLLGGQHSNVYHLPSEDDPSEPECGAKCRRKARSDNMFDGGWRKVPKDSTLVAHRDVCQICTNGRDVTAQSDTERTPSLRDLIARGDVEVAD